ncbi:hypothetical protein DVR12_05520 [Chitinophaga silvatica]|uniref:Uncharacterized protein n=2 Tax=Chitinophaga silvatica TaxID=2282649 RepID=A0A3E1YDR1_9BACT|nr:hypothetical protein DVR12_05520 [Chitinophaga silvatica]
MFYSINISAQKFTTDSNILKIVIKYLAENDNFKSSQNEAIKNGQIELAKDQYYIFRLFKLNNKKGDAVYVFGNNGAHSRRYLLVNESKNHTFYGNDKLESDLLKFNSFTKKYKPDISCKKKLKIYQVLIENYEILENVIIL